MDGDLFRACRQGPPYRPLSALPFLSLDLRYAGADNLCGVDLYGGEQEAWLHEEAWAGLLLCGAALTRQRPRWRFRVYDAIRPLSVQQRLFEKVAGTYQQAYVADPRQGSVHNFGFALDLGLENEDGVEQDLGTAFDSFDLMSQPQLEEALHFQGRLAADPLERRALLRSCMAEGGFVQHPMEWWHFDFKSLAELTRHYPMI